MAATKRNNFPGDPVQWHEGMLLSPQHFQQETLRLETMLQFRVQTAVPFYWGATRLTFDANRLGSGQVRIMELEGVMPDGLPVAHDTTMGELTVDLDAYADLIEQGPVPIYLSVLRFVEGHYSPEGTGRFTSYESDNVQDHYDEGGKSIQIPRLRPRLVLHVASAPESYVSMPIARVEVRNEAYTFTEYVAPQLRVEERSPIGRMVASFLRRLRNRAQVLDERQHQLSMASEHEEAAELRRQIGVIVTAIPQLEAVLRVGVSHPFALYVESCGLLGPLAALVPGQVPPELDPYDHNDPMASFQRAFGELDTLVQRGTQENFDSHRFDFDGRAFTMPLRAAWLDSPLILQVKRRRGVKDDELIRWMNESLIGSADRVERMMNARVLGLERKRVERFEELVPTRDTLLFELRADTRYLSQGQRLVVFNRDMGEDGARPTEIVLYVSKAS